MNHPTSEQPIVQGVSRGGVREPGSVIEERTAFAERVTLGAVERKCLTCGKAWIGPAVCGQNGCHGIEFEERDVRTTPMVINSMPAPNKADATPYVPRTVQVTVQNEEDLAVLVHLKDRLEATIQEMLGADEVLHRIMGRIPMDMTALFQEATTPREIYERNERMADVNREIWYGLQSTVHFASETVGDIPLGGDTAFHGSLVLQARHVINEIDRAIQKYEEALKK